MNRVVSMNRLPGEPGNREDGYLIGEWGYVTTARLAPIPACGDSPLIRRASAAYTPGMLGRNMRAKILKVSDPDLPLELSEIFYTIQGEGPHAGQPAVFIRLAGCPLACTWCDTEFETVRERISAEALAQKAYLLRRSSGRCGLAVITGGEPLRQNLAPLVRALNAREFGVQIEASGVHWREDLGPLFETRHANGYVPSDKNTLVVSPKIQTIPMSMRQYVHALKYIIIAGENCVKDGLPVRDPQKKRQAEFRLARPDQLGFPAIHMSQIYVQPCDSGHELQSAINRNAVSQISQRYGYRTSLQLHKIMKLP